MEIEGIKRKISSEDRLLTDLIQIIPTPPDDLLTKIGRQWMNFIKSEDSSMTSDQDIINHVTNYLRKSEIDPLFVGPVITTLLGKKFGREIGEERRREKMT